MPLLADFPTLAHASVLVAHWGIRLAKSIVAASLAAAALSLLHHRGAAFHNPLFPVLYACASNLLATWAFLCRLSDDEKYKALVSLWSLALRVLSCEVRGPKPRTKPANKMPAPSSPPPPPPCPLAARGLQLPAAHRPLGRGA